MSRPLKPPTPEQLAERIRQALGHCPADLVIKNVRIFDVVGGQLSTGDIAINGGYIVGVYDSYAGRREIDGRGLVAVPGFIDAHVQMLVTIERVCPTSVNSYREQPGYAGRVRSQRAAARHHNGRLRSA